MHVFLSLVYMFSKTKTILRNIFLDWQKNFSRIKKKIAINVSCDRLLTLFKYLIQKKKKNQ